MCKTKANRRKLSLLNRNGRIGMRVVWGVGVTGSGREIERDEGGVAIVIYVCM